MSKSLLIVDDNPDNIAILEGILQDRYTVKAAPNGPVALKIAGLPEGKQPELILLDIMMPGMDGYEVLENLQNDPHTRDIPVFFVSAKGDPEEKKKGLEKGAAEYIAKPIDPEKVLKLVAEYLGD